MIQLQNLARDPLRVMLRYYGRIQDVPGAGGRIRMAAMCILQRRESATELDVASEIRLSVGKKDFSTAETLGTV